MRILTCKLRNEIINCYNGTHDKEQLKKWASKKILLCPVCDKPYEYCHGKVKTPYFRHMDKAECEDKYSESETEEHLNGKRDLFEWIKKQNGVTNAVLEGWIPETKQRPDIMFEYGDKKYVIEYQCSPIATEYVERHDLYNASGIIDIWICGTSKYMKENMRLKELEKNSCGYYASDTKLFYFQNSHDGYGKDIHCFFDRYISSKNFGCENPINEDRDYGYSSDFCCTLEKLHFYNGEIIFKNYRNIENMLINASEKKRIRYKPFYKYSGDDYQKAKNIEEYIIKRLNNICNIQNWSSNCRIDEIDKNYYVSISISNLSTLYGEHNLEKMYHEKIYVSQSTYLSMQKVIKDMKNQYNDILCKENNIQNSIYYFTKKSHITLHIVNRNADIEVQKFYRVCKGKDYVSEFDFLNDLLRIIKTSSKYSKHIYIKTPRSISTPFGTIDCCWGSNINILTYFKRLGFYNVVIENK